MIIIVRDGTVFVIIIPWLLWCPSSLLFSLLLLLLWMGFQCSSLLDATQYDDFVEEISEEYDEIREEHYENLKVIFFASGCIYQERSSL